MPRQANLHKNVEMLQLVAKGLGPLLAQVVFIGGATTSLYIDDPAAPETTPSEDVDCLIEVANLSEYTKFEQALQKQKFKRPLSEDQTLICRWEYLGITVDIMPTETKVLGFSNPWYRDGLKHRQPITLPNGTEIHILPIEYFLATKLVAYEARGGNDIRLSHDMEDIISVIDGSSHVVEAVITATAKIQEYLTGQFKTLLKDHDLLEEAVAGFVRTAGESPRRISGVLGKIALIAKNDVPR